MIVFKLVWHDACSIKCTQAKSVHRGSENAGFGVAVGANVQGNHVDRSRVPVGSLPMEAVVLVLFIWALSLDLKHDFHARYACDVRRSGHRTLREEGSRTARQRAEESASVETM